LKKTKKRKKIEKNEKEKSRKLSKIEKKTGNNKIQLNSIKLNNYNVKSKKLETSIEKIGDQ